jgi:hypothetical protein
LQSFEVGKLCAALESLVLRKRLIGTRADITSRISDIFEKFTASNKNIYQILDRVSFLKSTTDPRWHFWNNESLEQSLQGELNHTIAKYILWKYETYLVEVHGANGEGKVEIHHNEQPR